MENFDMDADDPNEQENLRSPEKKLLPQSGIEIDALHGLLDSYTTGEIKVRNSIIFVDNDMIIRFFVVEHSSSSSSTGANSIESLG